MNEKVLLLIATFAFLQIFVPSYAVVGNPSAGHKKAAFVEVRSISRLMNIYEPHNCSVDLVCGKRPSIEDASVVYCAEAAFTDKCLTKFIRKNIVGDHVSGGVYYRSFRCDKANTGAFVYYKGKWEFLCKKNCANEFNLAAQNGGMGFSQNMIIFKSKKCPLLFGKKNPCNIYRALCDLNGKLCILESKTLMAYSVFVNELKKLGVEHALYLDMGSGWNYSWYRDAKGGRHIIHPQKKGSKYQTNWIVFRK